MQGPKAQVHAYGNVYRLYGDQWRGRKSVLHPEIDRNGEQLTDKSGNVEDAPSGQVIVCLRSASFDLCIRFLARFFDFFCFILPPPPPTPLLYTSVVVASRHPKSAV